MSSLPTLRRGRRHSRPLRGGQRHSRPLRGGQRHSRPFGGRTLALLSTPVAIAAIVTLWLAGGTTFALWATGTAFQGGTVTAGDLRVTTGELTWQQVTPGVVNRASGTLTGSPTGFQSMPGDVIEIEVPVTTYLSGDNLTAALTADFVAPASVDASIATTFHVENATQTQVAPDSGDAPIGSSLVVPGLVGDNAGVSAQWTVVLHVQVLGDYQWVTADSTSLPIDWSAGTVRVTLNQTRPTGGAG
jgi:alternate signal-mediated exported protein